MKASVVADCTCSARRPTSGSRMLLSSQVLPEPEGPLTQMCGRQPSTPQIGAMTHQPAKNLEKMGSFQFIISVRAMRRAASAFEMGSAWSASRRWPCV